MIPNLMATTVLDSVKIESTPKLENIKDLPKTNYPEYNINDNSEVTPNDRYMICRNESLEGTSHPVSGVEFERKVVELPDGSTVEGVFPKFESIFDVNLDETQFLDSDAKQFKEANMQLKEAVDNNPDLKEQFTAEQLEQIKADETPDGYVWHHSEDTGKLELVDSTTHTQTGHTGGRAIWGGGSEHR